VCRIGLSAYRNLYFIPLATLFFLGVALAASSPPSKGNDAGGFVLGMGFLWLVCGRWVSRWLVPVFVSTLSCPGCHEELDAIGMWSCSCGFHDHRERHILSPRACPLCEGKVGHVNCPRCDATILLW